MVLSSWMSSRLLRFAAAVVSGAVVIGFGAGVALARRHW
jgi:hypothetical protein